MRRVIDRTVYDTEKSDLVAEYSNYLSSLDFFYVFERLYRTRKGYFFLYAEGGPMSKYADEPDVIFPMHPKEAYYWLEKNNKVDEIEALFPEEIEEA